MFDSRQIQILRAVLGFAAMKVDAINDALACFTEEDPDNTAGMIEIGGERMKSISDEEIEKIRDLLQ